MGTIKKVYKIDGMHCTSCAMTIEMDLEDLEGVINVKTSYAKGETEVEFDSSKVTEETILETIKKDGYAASSVVS
ncbi:MAG: heavy-metal-associated domain-containing protein [Microgenomates group bacterium]|jgi:copper chaperone CopZ